MCGTTHMYFKVFIKFCTIREDLAIVMSPVNPLMYLIQVDNFFMM